MRDTDKVLVELHWALNAPTRRLPIEETGSCPASDSSNMRIYIYPLLGWKTQSCLCVFSVRYTAVQA